MAIKQKDRGETNQSAALKWGMVIVLLLLVSMTVRSLAAYKKAANSKEGRFNVVLIGHKSVDILSLEDGRSIIIKLPPEIEVKTTRGYGDYRLDKIYALGELDKKGGPLTAETVQEEFGLPVAGYILIEDDKENRVTDPVGEIQKAIFGKNKSDLSKNDLVWLWWKTNSSKKEETDYDQKLAKEQFKDRLVRNEGVTIEFFNGTEHDGLAGQGASIIENVGGRVVRIEASNMRTDQCRIYTSGKGDNSYTSRLIKSLFGCQSGTEPLAGARAEVSVVMGEGYWKKLEEKW